MKNQKNIRGFTLMEMLLAVTLFALVMTACYGVFSSGLHIWKRSQGRSSFERHAVLALERMGHDLRGAVYTRPKSYQGKDLLRGHGGSREWEMPGLIPWKTQKQDMIQFGKIRYQWDSARKELCRQEIPASDIESPLPKDCRVIASSLSAVKFRYLLFDKIGDSYSWYDEFDENDELPAAVEAAFELQTQLKGEKQPLKKSFQRIFWIPAGGLHPSEETKSVQQQASGETSEP